MMFCSTIIPTIGRPAVDRAVKSVLAQHAHGAELLSFEVIVVNDSGKPLPDAEWQRDPRVRVVETSRRERSVARNTGAALAKGQYLHFLDDDDWILPGALAAFHALAASNSADWLYGQTQLVDRQEEPLIKLDHGINGNGFIQTMAGEWIPLQSSLITATAFFAVGGFEPLISGPEDIDLLRRITLRGELAGMDTVVSCLGMGEVGSSTDTTKHAERSRWAREKILNQPGVFRRLRHSARSPEWHGRLIRIYATSIIWNVQQRNTFGALSRFVYTVFALLSYVGNWADGTFWRGLASAYQSRAFASH